MFPLQLPDQCRLLFRLALIALAILLRDVVVSHHRRVLLLKYDLIVVHILYKLLVISELMFNFAAKHKLIGMTTMQLNAEILRNMSVIAEDENLLKRAAKYMRKLVAEKEADPTLLTKEEFFARVDKAEKEIAEGKGVTFTNKDDMNAWLNSL